LFALELQNCDGSAAFVIANAECNILISTLRATPFSLSWGASVHAKVIAANQYGDSLTSEVGNGAVIITYADAPVSLAEIIASRTASSISFSWS
jgi:hypothetical protein